MPRQNESATQSRTGRIKRIDVQKLFKWTEARQKILFDSKTLRAAHFTNI